MAETRKRRKSPEPRPGREASRPTPARGAERVPRPARSRRPGAWGPQCPATAPVDVLQEFNKICVFALKGHLRTYKDVQFLFEQKANKIKRPRGPGKPRQPREQRPSGRAGGPRPGSLLRTRRAAPQGRRQHRGRGRSARSAHVPLGSPFCSVRPSRRKTVLRSRTPFARRRGAGLRRRAPGPVSAHARPPPEFTAFPSDVTASPPRALGDVTAASPQAPPSTLTCPEDLHAWQALVTCPAGRPLLALVPVPVRVRVRVCAPATRTPGG